MSKSERHYFKNKSGSTRDKRFATPKQDKWKDPFYAFARGKSKARSLFSHKVDSIRANVSADNSGDDKKGFFKMIGSAIKRFFGFNSRKGLA